MMIEPNKRGSDPTPEQIAQRCLEVQAGWSERERLSRLRADLRPMFTRCDGEHETMAAEVYAGHHATRAELQAMADP